MNILKSVKKIPGGLMVVPLLLGAIINTFFGGTIWTMFDGTFTTYLWKSGAMPILAVFIFCNATTINFKKAGVTVYKGVVITAVKVGVGIIIGLICGKLFGEAGGPGILLGVGCTLITGLVGYLVYKLLRMDHPEVGGAIGTTAGNAAATPASVAAVDATLLAVSEAATAQITAAIIVTAICCPILVSWLHKLEDKRRAAK